MPTFEWVAAFAADLARLTSSERVAFERAVTQFVDDLRRGVGFQKGLRVKKVLSHQDIWELTWAPDGRATVQYGPEQRPDEPHIIWRRIGGHEILKRP
ncbi:MAG TPA: hypothetical protein VKE25_15235 [Actinomycetes bacterium]|nr:hypothetical protein [Actinomycetes bacterium]